MADKTITSFFDRYDEAADAVRRLEAAGVPRRDISLIANNEGERYSSHASRTWDESSRFDDDNDGAATGATVGTLAGGTLAWWLTRGSEQQASLPFAPYAGAWPEKGGGAGANLGIMGSF